MGQVYISRSSETVKKSDLTTLKTNLESQIQNISSVEFIWTGVGYYYEDNNPIQCNTKGYSAFLVIYNTYSSFGFKSLVVLPKSDLVHSDRENPCGRMEWFVVNSTGDFSPGAPKRTLMYAWRDIKFTGDGFILLNSTTYDIYNDAPMENITADTVCQPQFIYGIKTVNKT